MTLNATARLAMISAVILVSSLPVLAEPEVIHLDPIWEYGGEVGEGVVGNIASVAFREDGVAYLLDDQQSTIHLIAPDGTFMKTVGRGGEGPGELAYPMAVAAAGDGQIAVMEQQPANLEFIDLSGLPVRNIPLDRGGVRFTGMIWNLKARAGQWVLSGAIMDFSENCVRYFVSGLEDGKLVPHYEHEVPFREGADERWYHFPADGYAIGRDGRVFVAPDHERYKIDVTDAAGRHLQTIERDYDALARPDSSLQKLRDDHYWEVTEHYTAIYRLERVGDEIWVVTGRGLIEVSGDTLRRFDVLDLEGNFLREVSLQCQGERYQGRLYFGPDDRVVMVLSGQQTRLRDEDHPRPAVVCYKLRRDSSGL